MDVDYIGYIVFIGIALWLLLVILMFSVVMVRRGSTARAAKKNNVELNKPLQNWTTLIILSILFGGLGVDRFYVGKIDTGILKLITFGGFGIWWFIDFIMICTKSFTNSEGQVIKE